MTQPETFVLALVARMRRRERSKLQLQVLKLTDQIGRRLPPAMPAGQPF